MGVERVGAIHKLKSTEVQSINKPGRYGDGGGLWLQVAPGANGPTKAWLFRYMLYGRARQMGLGPFSTISLQKARERAQQARELLLDKVDPIEDRLIARDQQRAQAAEAITFKEAADQFISVHEKQWKNEKHRQQWRNSLKTYGSTLSNRPVKSITPAVINIETAEIAARIPETAERVRQRIHRILQWVAEGRPLPTPSKARRVKHHAAMPYAELPHFMGELQARQSVSARALEFTILTGARTSETTGARWSEIDLQRKTWTVPAERMKAGKLHRVPLCERAVELLLSLPRESKGDCFVFPGGRPGKPLSNMAMAEMLKGISGAATVHGFRSSFRDWLKEQTNFPREIAELALAHVVKDGAERAYSRGDALERRRPMMAAWGRYCGQPPKDKQHDSNVTLIHARA